MFWKQQDNVCVQLPDCQSCFHKKQQNLLLLLRDELQNFRRTFVLSGNSTEMVSDWLPAVAQAGAAVLQEALRDTVVGFRNSC